MSRPLLLAAAVIAAVAAVSLTRAELALAGSTCGSSSGGGSSGGDDSSSSSDSSFFDDSSSSDSDSTPACVDATDLVGYRQCTGFARWASRPGAPILLELGVATRTFGSPLGEASGRLSHDDESFAYRVIGTPPGAATPATETAVVATARIGGGLRRGFYLAVDGELGGLTRTASRAEMATSGVFGAPSITPGANVVLGALGVAGVRGSTRRAALGVEAAGGLRAIGYQYESSYLTCVTTAMHWVTSPILEARARASYWLSPWVSVGATAGASVLERGAWMAGVHVGLVTQAFGGLRD